MKRKLDFNLSASTINYFCTCPWAFAQDKIHKRKAVDSPGAALVLGQAFHKLLEQFYTKQTWRTYDLFQNWGQMFDVEAKLQNVKLPELKFAKASGFTLLKNWVAMAKSNNWLHEAFVFDSGEKGIEYEFKLPYDNDRFEINVHGFMDLVIESNGRIYILDWKTGKHSKDKYFLQAVLYSWALYKKNGLIEDCVRFVHPSKSLNTVVDVKVHDEDYALIVEKVNAIFDAIEQNEFSKSAGDHCKWCKWVDCSFNTNENLKQLIKQTEQME
jgi:hypothetical protein